MSSVSRDLPKILLVEDDPATRRVVEQVLRDEGYEVQSQETVGEGLAILTHQTDIGLLLTDVCLPDGTATALAEAARRVSLDLPVVAMSGAADASLAFELARLGVRRFVRKPFTVPELLVALKSAMEEGSPLERVAELAVGQSSLPAAQAQVKGAMVQRAIMRARGNRRRAAQLLGISRQTVHSLVGPRGPRPRSKPLGEVDG